ncbi:hypothetical protein [Micromonospora carbonacea]|uniref:Tail assembly chaperone n=1 Tax=Micromonospora carbonacea TaxID=47853 RepID=A0A1C5ABU8_9ACTN|nr:hypothetical protein [Micromonospora carbonacea]SCF42685.1 hypothetical protein GA0070563_112114 [Micromonospora carbonacea]
MDFDSILDQATLAETTVALCLNGRLRAEYERLKAAIDERAVQAESGGLPGDDRLATKAPAPDPDQPELDRLADEMRRHTVEFTLRALPKPEWNALFAKHPPRVDKATGKREPKDGLGVNYDTFFPAFVRQSIVFPELSGDRWDRLYVKLSDAQFNKLANEAWDLNQVDHDVPFSPVSSQSPRNSAGS